MNKEMEKFHSKIMNDWRRDIIEVVDIKDGVVNVFDCTGSSGGNWSWDRFCEQFLEDVDMETRQKYQIFLIERYIEDMQDKLLCELYEIRNAIDDCAKHHLRG